MHCKFGMMAIFNATELSLTALTAVGAAFVFILYVVRQRMKQSHIPGPFLASITNIPRMRWGYSGRAHEIHIELHKRYGNLVRLGPNCISVGDPLAIPQIYGTGANFPKVSFCLESQVARPLQSVPCLRFL